MGSYGNLLVYATNELLLQKRFLLSGASVKRHPRRGLAYTLSRARIEGQQRPKSAVNPVALSTRHPA